jgi:hypothetical protein
MIDREHELPITKQAQALGIGRGGVYYLPRPMPPQDLAIIRRLDQLHMDYPFAGARMLSGLLNGEGFAIGRKHTASLMKKMGISALYCKPNTSKPAPGHKIYPYLLRSLKVKRANQAGHGHHLYPDGQRLPLSGLRTGLAHTPRALVAVIDRHHGHLVLHRSCARGSGKIWEP